MNIRFDNRVVVITGAGGGLGRCYAIDLARRGARLCVNDLGGAVDGTGSSEIPARSLVKEIEAAGGEVIANYDDVSHADGANNLIRQTIDRFGAIDALICNAGILRDKTFLKMPLEDFELVLRVHLLGTVYVTRAAFPVMKEKKYGRIVFTTSASGLFGNFGQTNYAAAKLGIVGFMNSLKLEALTYNVLINTIAPLALTRLAVKAFPEDSSSELKPEFISPAVTYLCSEQCRTTGDIISAGGGWYRRVQIVEGRGIKIESQSDASPEMIARNFDSISLMEGARPFASAQEEFASILESCVDNQRSEA